MTLQKDQISDFVTKYRAGRITRRQFIHSLSVIGALGALHQMTPGGLIVPAYAQGAPKRGGTLNVATIDKPVNMGIMLILALSLGLGLFPSSGYVPLSEGLGANLAAFSLPSLTLAAGLAAVMVRITRAAVAEVASRDFVRFLRAKGLSETRIVYRHILRNASVPIITVLGLQFGYLLGGAVIVEQVFSLPGVGSLIVNAALERNYPVVQAGMLVVALLFILVNLTTDILYAILNPRIGADR